MKKERKAENFLPKPTYPGGPRKMSAFIKQHLKYPKESIKAQINGVVRIKIEIDFQGRVIGSKILSGLDESCNVEAERLVKLLKFNVDHKVRKGKIMFFKTLNIKFNPPQIKPATNKQNTTLNYKLTPSKESESVNVDQKIKRKIIYKYTLKY